MPNEWFYNQAARIFYALRLLLFVVARPLVKLLAQRIASFAFYFPTIFGCVFNHNNHGGSTKSAPSSYHFLHSHTQEQHSNRKYD
jgi:hypothetical protein